LFVSDLHTGMIHRFALDGKELGAFDHGVTGLGAAKLAPVPFNPRNRPNIASDRFDSEKPDTWGFAPAARRVWGLAVHEGRLYYSVVSGPQIWSVGIERDGGFAADPRWELDVPAQAGPLPISDIAFSQKGAMILAQRALIAGAYDYSAFTRPGEPQVLRVWLKGPNDPQSPGRWKLVPEEYAIGFAGNDRNSNGGVALGYGYGQDGMLAPQACEAALWTTGQNLRNNPALRSQLEPGGPLVVNGLQGSPADMVRPTNTPPATSYLVDYDDKFDDPRASGHMGSVRIFAQPCASSTTVAPVATIVPIVTPIGCVGPNCRNVCTPTCVCPNGGVLKDGKCVEACEPPMVINPRTHLCECPPGTALKDGKCIPILTVAPPHSCLPPLVLDPLTGLCVPPKKECLPPLVFDPLTGLCVPPKQECVPPLVLDPVTHTCVCPPGSVMQDGKCVPQICPSPLVPGPCECPEGTVRNGQLCLPITPIDVKIEKTGGTTPYCPAPYYSFTIKVTNGPNPWPGTGNIVVTDTVPANMTFGPISAPGWSCNGLSPPAGTTFTCTYTGPAPTTNQVLPLITIPATATVGPPFPPFTNCASVAIPSSSGYTDSNSANNNSCTTVTKPSSCDCPLPQVLNSDGICACPNGQVLVGGACVPPPTTCTAPQVPNVDGICECPAPMQPGAVPGQCICPLPNVMVNGVCVQPPPVCTAPQVPNVDGICACPAPMQPGAVPGQCICPLPNVMVNGACVLPPPVCTAPQVPNVDGICACPAPMQPGPTPGSCKCPQGMTLVGGACVTPPPPVRKQTDKVKKPRACAEGTIRRGSKCVKRERSEPHVAPRDVIRGIDVFRGLGGGGGGGGRGGGGGGGGGKGGRP
jgi:uncharacterized repeat protein (TIGR01451 family)